jgi:hypothetical protein
MAKKTLIRFLLKILRSFSGSTSIAGRSGPLLKNWMILEFFKLLIFNVQVFYNTIFA